MSSNQPSPGPSPCSVLHTLQDGFWDLTEVIQLRDGSLRVRKSSKGERSPGPWGVTVLRREIQYMRTLDERAAKYFPELLVAWDNTAGLGYEMSHVDNAIDVGTLARSGAMTQMQTDAFQEGLAEAVFRCLHRPVEPKESLARHLYMVIEDVLRQLTDRDEFSVLINARTIELNGHRMRGPRSAFRLLAEGGGPMAAVDRLPCVRLHGDLFLENILLPQQASNATWPVELMLLDPVSVAGVQRGHPLFDLVKYESYATGELLALRSEKVEVEDFGRKTRGHYVYRVQQDEPTIRPFYQVDWCGRFRAAYIRKYGQIDWMVYRLFEAYFALVMALCTEGLQRQARLLKGTWALNVAMSHGGTEPKPN